MVSMHEEGAWPEKARYLQLQRMSMCLLVLVCKNDITMDCWKTQYMTERGTQASASRVFISSQDEASGQVECTASSIQHALSVHTPVLQPIPSKLICQS